MKEQEIEILHRALKGLLEATNTNIKVEHYWHTNSDYDATGSVLINEQKILLAIKLTVRPTLAMMLLTRLKQTDEQPLIVADYINPVMAERLKSEDIWFLDTAGNAYLQQSLLYIYIKGNKPLEKLTARSNRAFLPSGLKVIYAFLSHPELLNSSYREIAETAEVALGTIGLIIADLVQLGHIVELENGSRRLQGKRKLLERWLVSYPEKLRPKLELGRYTALSSYGWQGIAINNVQAYWGGEVAADALTDYLQPEIITIYLPEKQLEKLILTNRLRQDPNGNIELLKTFWNVESEVLPNNRLVHPILIYADLMASGIAKKIEAAQAIYEQELAPYFRED